MFTFEPDKTENNKRHNKLITFFHWWSPEIKFQIARKETTYYYWYKKQLCWFRLYGSIKRIRFLGICWTKWNYLFYRTSILKCWIIMQQANQILKILYEILSSLLSRAETTENWIELNNVAELSWITLLENYIGTKKKFILKVICCSIKLVVGIESSQKRSKNST